MSPTKAALRRELLARRKGLAQRQEKDEKLRKTLWSWPCYETAEKLFLFLSAGSEPDTWTIFARALEQQKEVYLPRCLDGEGRMAFFQVTCRDQLEPGRFGIFEPDPQRCSRAQGTEGALCLVPGIAFDRDGYRLGYGKGYYDRFLADFQGIAAGMCYGELVLSQLPRGPHDRRVRWLVTETGVEPVGKEGCI